MGVYDFTISTNHPFNKYKPGQTVRGKVHFKLSELKRVRGVYIKLNGKAMVEWRQTTNIGTITSIKYSSEHEYFNDRIYFVGSDGGVSFNLPAGEHNYKFEYTLPKELPSSFKGLYGRIEYKLSAILDIPFGFNDVKETILNITSPIDLNTMAYLKRPDHFTKKKHLCCWCCASGPISIEVYLPKTGFAYGEKIPIQIEVENQTNTEIRKINCTLKQQIVFIAKHPFCGVQVDSSTLADKILPGVGRRTTETYEVILTVPMCSIINFTNCNFLIINYHLIVSACISGMHTNLDVVIPIRLGSIPIAENMDTQLVSIFFGLGTPYPHDEQDRSNCLSKLIETSAGWRIPQDKDGSST